jgi:hypothetical protein
MCSADVSVLYWWNANYNTTDLNGVKHEPKLYEGVTHEERVEGSFVGWDVEHQYTS